MQKLKADIVAHGSTDAGNDQVGLQSLISRSVRDQYPYQGFEIDRESEISYLKSKGVEMNLKNQCTPSIRVCGVPVLV